jgi:hypothetical protein
MTFEEASGLGSFFFFATASFGFLYFIIRYSRASEVRQWGIRVCYLMGFAGVLFLRLSREQFDFVCLMILCALVISLAGFEFATRYLK